MDITIVYHMGSISHPSRSNFFRGKRIFPDYSIGYAYTYSDRLGEILKSEIKEVVEFKFPRTVYVQNIFKHYGIEVANKTEEMNESFVDIRDLQLSARSYNCLKHHGIDTLEELIDLAKSDEELMKVRNLGRKSMEEIKNMINRIEEEKDAYNTLEVKINGEKIVYKYLDDDCEKIATSVFCMIKKQLGGCKEIINGRFSPGLKELLLLKGYLFESDVYENAEILENELTAFGFPQYAEEIKKVKETSNIDLNNYERVFACRADDDIIDVIKKHNCTNIDMIKEVAAEQEYEKLNDFISEIDFDN